MIRVVAKHEVRQLLEDRVCIGAALFLFFCVLVALFNAGKYASDQLNALHSYKARENQRLAELLAQDAKTVVKVDSGELKIPPRTNSPIFTPLFAGWAANESQRDAILPPTPLAFLGIGQSDTQPLGLRALTPGRYLYQTEPVANQTRSPLRMAIGNLDMTFVVIYLIPVVVIAFLYNVLSGDRDNGTLPLLLSYPITLRSIVLVKVFVRLCFLAGAFIAPMAIGIVLLNVDLTAPGNLLGLSVWILLAFLYGSFWATLALVANMTSQSSAKNALVLSVFWIMLVSLLPPLLVFACSSVWPLPAPTELIDATRDAMMQTRIYDIAGYYQDLQNPGSPINRYIATFCSNHPEFGCAPGRSIERNKALVLGAPMEEVNRLTLHLTQRYTEQLHNQEQAMSYLRFLSPASMTEPILTEFAGTSVSRYRRFQQETFAAHERWRLYFWKLSYQRGDLPLHPADYTLFPYFEYHDPPMWLLVQKQAVPGTYLVVLTLLLLLWSFAKSRRYPVTG